jgi:RNA recognition motif-containing protein
MKIYAGNLSYGVTDEELMQIFSEFGKVESATVIKDKYSGDSKGFGFVEMSSRAEAQAAIEELDGREMNGRALKVNEARPRPDSRSDRGGRGGPGGQKRGRSGGRGRGF